MNAQRTNAFVLVVHGLFLWAFVLVLVRHITATAAAATAAVTIARLFTEWLCYVLGRLHKNTNVAAVLRFTRATTKAQRKRLSTSKAFSRQ